MTNGWKRKAQGGVLAFIGFMLSPLSWWNDLFVNIPLAVGFAWLVAFFYRPAFESAVIIGYWLTNLIGFVLLHKGTQRILAQQSPHAHAHPYWPRGLLKDFVVSLLYTTLIVLLILFKAIRPITDYWR